MVAKMSKESISKMERLYATYKTAMYKEALLILRDPNDAEDVIQQSFMKLIPYTENITEDKPGMTCNFLKTVVRNLSRDFLRRRRYLNSNEDSIDTLEDDHNFLTRCTIDVVIEKESIDRISKAIENLPPKLRDVVLLEKVFGYSRKETIRLLNSNYETLKKRMTRAKTQLLKNLTEEDLNGGRKNIGKVRGKNVCKWGR